MTGALFEVAEALYDALQKVLPYLHEESAAATEAFEEARRALDDYARSRRLSVAEIARIRAENEAAGFPAPEGK